MKPLWAAFLALPVGLLEGVRDLALADAERAQADQAYAKDPTDAAFDQEFRR